MVLADAGGNVVTMTYNALGQRISKDASSGTTYFRYDGNNLLQETDSGGNVSRSYTTTDEEYGDLISEHEGFAVNEKKRRVLRQNSSQRVTGIVVNAAPGVPREVRRRLLAALHRARQSAEGITPQMAGMVAYVQMVNPAQAAVLRRGMQSSS
jgi:YD repeat-containing protein